MKNVDIPRDESYKRLIKDTKVGLLMRDLETQAKFSKASAIFEVLKEKGFFEKSKDKLYECMVMLAIKDFEGVSIEHIYRYLWDECNKLEFNFHRCVGPITDKYIDQKRINEFLFIKFHYPHVKKGYQFMVAKRDLVMGKYDEIKDRIEHHSEINYLNCVGYLEFFCKNYDRAKGLFEEMLEKMNAMEGIPKGRFLNAEMMIDRCNKRLEKLKEKTVTA